MTLIRLPFQFSVCKVPDSTRLDWNQPYLFVSKTPQECSVVCLEGHVPANATHRKDGWRALMVEGPLDFSLTGILSQLLDVLAREEIGVFAVSTYDTDYIFMQESQMRQAVGALQSSGHTVEEE